VVILESSELLSLSDSGLLQIKSLVLPFQVPLVGVFRDGSRGSLEPILANLNQTTHQVLHNHP